VPLGLVTKDAPDVRPGRLIRATGSPRRDTVRTPSAKVLVTSLSLRSMKFNVSRASKSVTVMPSRCAVMSCISLSPAPAVIVSRPPPGWIRLLKALPWMNSLWLVPWIRYGCHRSIRYGYE